MMHGTGKRQGRGRIGSLLLAAQLAALVLLPLLHSHVRPNPRPHAEAPGTPHHSHTDSACHVCRLADGRFVGSARPRIPDTPPRSEARLAAGRQAPQPHRRVHAPAAPRPPPLA
jgi:hypothetical protein